MIAHTGRLDWGRMGNAERSGAHSSRLLLGGQRATGQGISFFLSEGVGLLGPGGISQSCILMVSFCTGWGWTVGSEGALGINQATPERDVCLPSVHSYVHPEAWKIFSRRT